MRHSIMTMAATMIFVASHFLLVVSPSLADELKTVEARTLTLKVPASWESVATNSQMRAAQFNIPGKEDNADLTVFYFGGPTGGVQANVERWIGQFDAKHRELKMSQGKCAAGRFILVDAVGTWNKPDGPPFAQQTVATPNSRVVNVIVIEEADGETDYYFLKLSGTKSIVGEQIDALRTAIGIEADSEKPFELKDAEN